MEGQVPVFISPRNKVAELYLRALSSLYVASYDSQGYRGGILTSLHARQTHTTAIITRFTEIRDARLREWYEYMGIRHIGLLSTD
jgi:hypothetical protein